MVDLPADPGAEGGSPKRVPARRRSALLAEVGAIVVLLGLALVAVPLALGTWAGPTPAARPVATSAATPAVPTATTAVVVAASPTGLAQVEASPTLAAPTPTAAATLTPPLRGVQRYTVAPGDSLRLIAERFGVSTRTLIAANHLANPDLLQVGQELLVPPVDGVLHTLQPGESLAEVAGRYGVDPSAIVAASNLNGTDPALVAAGTLLVIPGVVPDLPAAGAAEVASPAQQAAPLEAASLPDAAPSDAAASPAPPQRVNDAPPPPVTAQRVAILDDASGALLYGNDEHVRAAPASTTKIATTLVALEREPDLGRLVPVAISGSAMAARDGSSIMGLEPGLQVSLLTLLYGMMLPSGNDAAEQVALALAGSRERYVAWMNERVVALGLQDTHFANPSGMDAPDHYSSAYDMALLAREAMRNATFRALAGAPSYEADGFQMRNLNRLIGSYPGADGVKIGYTRDAGRTIVASATREGHRVYVSLMRSEDLYGEAAALFDWVWSTFRWQG